MFLKNKKNKRIGKRVAVNNFVQLLRKTWVMYDQINFAIFWEESILLGIRELTCALEETWSQVTLYAATGTGWLQWNGDRE